MPRCDCRCDHIEVAGNLHGCEFGCELPWASLSAPAWKPGSKGDLRRVRHSPEIRQSTSSGSIDSDLKSTYCFCAHMHEMMKYFLFTEIHEQCLNQLSGPSWQSSICLQIDRVTIPSESLPLLGSMGRILAILDKSCPSWRLEI